MATLAAARTSDLGDAGTPAGAALTGGLAAGFLLAAGPATAGAVVSLGLPVTSR